MPDEPSSPTSQPLERKLSTILSADVAEYSRLMGEDEEQTLKTFGSHKQVFESLVAAHRGRIFNTAGDAILAEFGSAVEAVRCATEIQAALHTANEHLPPSRQVRFRIGINLGDVMVHGKDLLGDGVNIAARLQTAAEPGGVCISGSVHDQIRNKLSLSFQSLGEINFKNIRHSVRTFSVTEAESHSAPPSSEVQPSAPNNSSAKWIVAAALVLVAGGYWAYSKNQQGKAEEAHVLAEAAKQEAAQHDALTAEKLAAEDAERKVAAERQALENTRREKRAPTEHRAPDGTASPAESKSKQPDATAQMAATTPTPPPRVPAATPAAPASTTAAARALPDGVYVGPVCYGQGAQDPPRCFRAQATLSNGKITGQWPMGRDPGTTMFLLGDVSPSGDVTIHMHTESTTNAHETRIDLTGTLHNARLDATGKFRNGRAATINWHKNLSPAPLPTHTPAG